MSKVKLDLNKEVVQDILKSLVSEVNSETDEKFDRYFKWKITTFSFNKLMIEMSDKSHNVEISFNFYQEKPERGRESEGNVNFVKVIMNYFPKKGSTFSKSGNFTFPKSEFINTAMTKSCKKDIVKFIREHIITIYSLNKSE